jgi:hypothetical protein
LTGFLPLSRFQTFCLAGVAPQTSSQLAFRNFFRCTKAVCVLQIFSPITSQLEYPVAGLSHSVVEDRNALILSQLEAHAPNKERYSLVAKVVNVGVALLVYALDDGVSRHVRDVQTQWTGCGPAFMGNKGAVGVRFRIQAKDGDPGELYT